MTHKIQGLLTGAILLVLALSSTVAQISLPEIVEAQPSECRELNRWEGKLFHVPEGEEFILEQSTAIVAQGVLIEGTLTTSNGSSAPSLCISTASLVVGSNGVLCTGSGDQGEASITRMALGGPGGAGGNLTIDLAGTVPQFVVMPGGRVCTGDGGDGGGATSIVASCGTPQECVESLHCEGSGCRAALEPDTCQFISSSIEIDCLTGQLDCEGPSCIQQLAILCSVTAQDSPCWPTPTCDGTSTLAFGGHGGPAGQLDLRTPIWNAESFSVASGAIFVGKGGDGGTAVALSMSNGKAIASSGSAGPSPVRINGHLALELFLAGDPLANALVTDWVSSSSGGDGGDAYASSNQCPDSAQSMQSSSGPDACTYVNEVLMMVDERLGDRCDADICGLSDELNAEIPGVCGEPLPSTELCDYFDRAPGTCGKPLPSTDPCDYQDVEDAEVPGTCGEPLPSTDVCDYYDDAPGTCGEPLPSTDLCDYFDDAPGTCGNPTGIVAACSGLSSNSDVDDVATCLAYQLLDACQNAPSQCSAIGIKDGPTTGEDGHDDDEEGDPAPTGMDGSPGDDAKLEDADVEYQLSCGPGLSWGLTGPSAGIGCGAVSECTGGTSYAATNGDHAQWAGAKGGDATAEAGNGEDGLIYGGNGGRAMAFGARGARGHDGGAGGDGAAPAQITAQTASPCTNEDIYNGAHGGYGSNAGAGGSGFAFAGNGGNSLVFGGNGGDSWAENGGAGPLAKGGDAGAGANFQYCAASHSYSATYGCHEPPDYNDVWWDDVWSAPGTPGCGGYGNTAGSTLSQPGVPGGIVLGMPGIPTRHEATSNSHERGTPGDLSGNPGHPGGYPNMDCPIYW